MDIRQAGKKIRLVALDLDGTSMNSAGVITLRTRLAIEGLIRRGYMVVPATGRGFYGLREETIGVQGIRYVISGNGAILTDGETGQRLAQKLIPYRVAASLADELLREGTCLYVQTSDAQNTHYAACYDYPAFRAHFTVSDFPPDEHIRGEKLGGLLVSEGRDVIELGVYFHGFDGFSVFDRLLSSGYPKLRWFRVNSCAMEFISQGVSKASALEDLCARLAITPEEVCAIGDNGNDVEMLRFAGLGVAMGNAHREVQEAADLVAGTNDEEGAAEFFEEYLLN